VGKGRDAVETQSLPDLLFVRLAIMASINNFTHCESVPDTVDAFEDIHTEISIVGSSVSELLVD